MNMPTHAPKYPKWFNDCLDTPCVSGEATVDGCRIHFASWGESGQPGIVLIHGSNAHLEWWRMIAPMLSNQFQVVAFDLSGSGDSGWRDKYSGEIFADEVMAVAAAAGIVGKPFVVGHSFGGKVALDTGHLHGADLSGVIMVDFTVKAPNLTDKVLEAYKERLSAHARPTRVYADREAALARFRLLPKQACNHPFLVTYLAEHSIRQVEGGWTWKFDPGLFSNLSEEDWGRGAEKVLNLDCPSAFIMAEESLDYSAQSVEFTRKLTNGMIPMFDIPGTQHHVMLDEPVALAMALKGVLMTWHSKT